MYKVGRLGFFVRAQQTFCFGRNWHVLIYSARKTLAQLGKKILFTDIDKKNDSRRRPGKMTDRGLKKKHHQMTPIEHFLTAIMQISFTDWIENSIADIGREICPTDIFQPTLRNFFLKTLAGRQCFFTFKEVFLFWCCIKNLQSRSARFFCASSTDVWLRPKLACSQLFAQENISPTWQKNIIHRYWYKKMTVDVGQERWTIGV